MISTSGLNELIAEDPRRQKGAQRLVLKTGGVLWAKSLHDDRRIRGRGLDFVATDEAAMQPSAVPWTQALRPSLTDHEGGGLFTSTPKGQNYFKDFHDRGNKDLLAPGELDHFPDWQSWTFPTSSNPYIKASEIADAKAELSEVEFAQEYEARFLDDIGSVFRGYLRVADEPMKADGDYAIVADLEKFPHARFVVGVDLAIHGDFTVLWVVDVLSGRPAYVERFNKIDWDGISSRIAAVSRRFGGAPVVIDATNNASFVDQVQGVIPWTSVEGFIFTKQSKAYVVNELALAVEKSEFHLPDSATRLGRQVAREFGAMQYVRSKLTGAIKIEASPGEHDDIPIAAGLARYLATQGIGGAPRIPNSDRDLPSMSGLYTSQRLEEEGERATRGTAAVGRSKKRFRGLAS